MHIAPLPCQISRIIVALVTPVYIVNGIHDNWYTSLWVVYTRVAAQHNKGFLSLGHVGFGQHGGEPRLLWSSAKDLTWGHHSIPWLVCLGKSVENRNYQMHFLRKNLTLWIGKSHPRCTTSWPISTLLNIVSVINHSSNFCVKNVCMYNMRILCVLSHGWFLVHSWHCIDLYMMLHKG